MRSSRSAALACLLLVSGCASIPHRDPLIVTVAGIEPLDHSEGLEMRMMVKLRVQNPNDAPVDYNGMAVQMAVQGKSFASGVSDETGSVPRFGEAVVSVPITISAMNMIKQAMGLFAGSSLDKVHYEMKGKFHSPGLSHTHFSTTGDVDLTGLKSAGSAP
ncbi:MAG TPA: LEA type 2 family protein [Candidatus Polarisedimenticolaceae bacterium]|nr:LEA type 2 family protein [Candidatus Polarisedimenticolaceae bacterium]